MYGGASEKSKTTPFSRFIRAIVQPQSYLSDKGEAQRRRRSCSSHVPDKKKKKQIGSIQKERKDGPPPRQPDIITTTPAIPLSLCHSYTLPLPTHAQSPRKK